MFSGDDSDVLAVPVDLDFGGPPTLLAYATFAVGAISILLGLIMPKVGAAGYLIGCCAVLTGIAYRAVLKSRQSHPMFLPNYVTTRIMLSGVFLGFVGIVLGAYHLATHTAT